MDKRAAVFAVVVLALLLLAALAYTSLEIYPAPVYRSPSREVLVNDFFALEQWLAQTGHPVRFEKRGDPARIIAAPEKTVFVQASVFDWEDAGEPLGNWIAAGGFLLVSLEGPVYDDEARDAFLSGFGVRAEIFEGPSGDSGTDDEEDRPPVEALPDFDGDIYFNLSEEAAASGFTITDAGAAARLVWIPHGEGAVVFIGGPRFMRNSYLEREANARLAWDVTGARAGEDSPGLLFIRGRRQVKSLFGKLADRGNFLPLGVSALILLAMGFWMVIPGFGLLFQEEAVSRRPIRERFLAETRFLKKYGALETYLRVYIREIKRKLRGREPEPELEAIEKVLSQFQNPVSFEIGFRKSSLKPAFSSKSKAAISKFDILKSPPLSAKGRLPHKELIRNLQILGTMMERL